MEAEFRSLADAISTERGLIVVLTGAGISLASGIPTFRGNDPGALWARDVTEMATLRYFLSNPVGAWSWYRKRFLQVLTARPNPAHHALADLERWQVKRRGDFLLVTQNIDTLHERAASRRVVKVHGSADRCRCADESCRLGSIDSLALSDVSFAEFDEDPRLAAIPRCPLCGTLVRPHVLWFDEYYTSHADYGWHVVDAAAPRLRLLIAIGTSLSVGVTSFLQSAASQSRAPVFLIDPAARAVGAHPSSVHLCARAEEILPAVHDALTASGGV